MNKELQRIHSRLSKLHRYLVSSIQQESLQRTSQFGLRENLVTFETSVDINDSAITSLSQINQTKKIQRNPPCHHQNRPNSRSNRKHK